MVRLKVFSYLCLSISLGLYITACTNSESSKNSIADVPNASSPSTPDLENNITIGDLEKMAVSPVQEIPLDPDKGWLQLRTSVEKRDVASVVMQKVSVGRI